MAEHSAENDAALEALDRLADQAMTFAGDRAGRKRVLADFGTVLDALARPKPFVIPSAAPVDMCHNGHPFVPGIDIDHPDEPHDDWCNSCGEARVTTSTETAEGSSDE